MLDCFCENLEAKHILIYLAPIMAKLSVLMANESYKIKEMTVAAIGSMALAAQQDFAPYFNGVATALVPLMSLNEPQYMVLRGK